MNLEDMIREGNTVHPPPPPPGSSMSGIILFGGPHWSIIKMLTPYKLGRPHIPQNINILELTLTIHGTDELTDEYCT